MRTAEALDYVEQGEGRFFFPVCNARVIIATGRCSCGSADCDHVLVARAAALVDLAREGVNGNADSLGELIELLRDKRVEFDAELTSRVERAVNGELFRCKRCGRWRDWCDESEDKSLVCCGCLPRKEIG